MSLSRKLYKFHKSKYLLYLIFIYLFIIKYNKKSRPKISVFLPIYNKENYLVNCIKKLQNQTLKDIEIVAVNDCSTDKSLEILTHLAINDTRIKIVNNDKNHGLLYSRAMGILNSSGEFLMNLDPDDEIKDEDSLEYIYNQSKFYNIDIIAFNAIDKRSNQIIKCIDKNKIFKPPELFSSLFFSDHIIKEYVIWNKLIKKEIFLYAYEDFKEKIYNGKWNYFEDDIWNILVNKYAQSRLCVDKLVYIYNFNRESLMNKRNGNIQYLNLIFRHEMYEKIFSLKKDQDYLIREYYFLLNRLKNKKSIFLLLNDRNLTYQFTNIFQLFLKKYNVSQTNTKKINDFLNSISLH